MDSVRIIDITVSPATMVAGRVTTAGAIASGSAEIVRNTTAAVVQFTYAFDTVPDAVSEVVAARLAGEHLGLSAWEQLP